MTPSAALRVALLAAAAALVGAVTGLASVAVHGLPWGPPLLTLAALAGLLALPARWSTRLPFALGWGLVVLVAVRGRPEGDVAVIEDGPGWLLVLLVGVLPMLALVTTWSASRRAEPGRKRPATGRGRVADRRRAAT